MIKQNSQIAAKPYAGEKENYLQPAVEAIFLAHQQVLMSSGEDQNPTDEEW